jgi:hypothetical protein
MILSEEDFESQFQIVRNNADGNCLFESMEHLLNFSEYEFKYGITKSAKIRKMVSDFYKRFDRCIDYPESTVEYKIKMGVLFDNMDEDGLSHEDNILNDKVWASMTDVLICSLLFEMNIYLFVKNDSFTFEENEVIDVTTYEMSKIETQYDFKSTIYLLYSGGNHFEALERKK